MVRRMQQRAVVGLSAAAIAGAAAVWGGCTGDDPADPPPDICATYCIEMTKACTGANRQYRSEEECRSACALLPPGTPDDVGLNTVGCRLKQARAAQCVAAGPYGGETCGSRCEAYCDIVEKNCIAKLGAPNAPYASKSDCLESCGRDYTFDPAVGEGPDIPFLAGDNLNCREHHLILAISDPSGHCGHAGPKSPTCFTADAGASDAATD